jgi:hypothetical protein
MDTAPGQRYRVTRESAGFRVAQLAHAERDGGRAVVGHDHESADALGDEAHLRRAAATAWHDRQTHVIVARPVRIVDPDGAAFRVAGVLVLVREHERVLGRIRERPARADHAEQGGHAALERSAQTAPLRARQLADASRTDEAADAG